jgi:hypothetical protein
LVPLVQVEILRARMEPLAVLRRSLMMPPARSFFPLMAAVAVTVPTQTLLAEVAEVAVELGLWALVRPVHQGRLVGTLLYKELAMVNVLAGVGVLAEV